MISHWERKDDNGRLPDIAIGGIDARHRANLIERYAARLLNGRTQPLLKSHGFLYRDIPPVQHRWLSLLIISMRSFGPGVRAIQLGLLTCRYGCCKDFSYDRSGSAKESLHHV